MDCITTDWARLYCGDCFRVLEEIPGRDVDSKKYFDVARRRIEAAENQLSMFPLGIPSVEKMRKLRG